LEFVDCWPRAKTGQKTAVLALQMSNAPPSDGKDAWARDQMQKIGQLVDEELPQGWGFFVMAFPFGELKGRMNFVANGQREDIVKLMKEFIEKQEKEQDWKGHH